MCEPTTLALIASTAVSAIGAFSANSNANAAAQAQQEAQNSNTLEGYRVAQVKSRAAESQAFEQQTDRMRQAAQQLSMSRVVAAEGGGSLAANAINITGAAADDFSRIDTNLTEQKSTVRDGMASLQTGNLDASKSASIALKGSQTKFFADIASTGANAYVGHTKRQSDIKLAQNYADSNKLKR